MIGPRDESNRGMVSVVGVALLLGLALLGATLVVTYGVGAINDVERSAKTERAETAMTTFDSKASLVALGSSSAQRIDLGGADGGRLSVKPAAGRIEILSVNDTDTLTIVNKSLGAVVYRQGDTKIAYQGGGVWRASGGGTTTVSSPEYHYREQTLTFPIVRVTGEPWTASPDTPFSVRNGGTKALFPNETLHNPLTRGHVRVEFTSEYHRGWKSFLERRAEGHVEHDPSNETVAVNLTVPVTEDFGTAVAATSDDASAITHSGSPHGGFGGNTLTGVDRPSVSPEIDQAISDCESGGCQDLSSALGDGALEGGTYFADSSVSIPSTTFRTGSGGIDVVVDGDVTVDGSLTVTGDNRTAFYVRGDVTIDGNSEVNTGGDPDDVVTKVSADRSITLSGTPQYTGYIYAPNAALSIDGGGNPRNDNVVGAAVVHNATAVGNGNLRFEPPAETELEFDTMTDITFLHVSESRLTVERE